ncbi:hypothetical protein L901_05570 [Agrobacterium sp. D14]|nr:hypothetical protein L901_05570 [Agrobacterium sp. D14]
MLKTQAEMMTGYGRHKSGLRECPAEMTNIITTFAISSLQT